jgi:hypothetical protein
MHIHNTQLDPNLLQINAVSATARAEEKKQAELTRKQLLKAASSLPGDYEEDCVVSLSGDAQSEEDQPHRQSPEDRENPKEQPTEDTALFSDWA